VCWPDTGEFLFECIKKKRRDTKTKEEIQRRGEKGWGGGGGLGYSMRRLVKGKGGEGG
jgi:hypothetical protein